MGSLLFSIIMLCFLGGYWCLVIKLLWLAVAAGEVPRLVSGIIGNEEGELLPRFC